MLELLVAAAGGFYVATVLWLFRPLRERIRWGCPRCMLIVGDAWALGRHLADCGRRELPELAPADGQRPS